MVLPHVFGCLFFVLLLVKLRDPRSLAWAAVFLPLLCADLSSFARRADETRAALKGLDDARETGVIPPDALDQMRGGAGGAPVAPENAGGDVEAPPLAPVVAPRRAPLALSEPALAPLLLNVLRPAAHAVDAVGVAGAKAAVCAYLSGAAAAAAASSTRRAGRGAARPDVAPSAAERRWRPGGARDGDAAPAAAETPDDDDDDASRADDDEPDAAAKRAAAFACSRRALRVRAVQPALVAKLDGDLDATWGLVFAPAWGVLAIFVGVATTLCNCAPLLSAGMPARLRRRAVRLVSLCAAQLLVLAGCSFLFLLARARAGKGRSRGASTRTRRTAAASTASGTGATAALEAASLAGDAYGALPALNVTAAFDSLCGALDKRDAKSSPTTDAILLPVICMYAALFVLHPLVLRDSKKFQQVVQIVVIEADDGLAEARAQLARQQLQGVFELSGAPRSMIGVEDDSVLVEALAMPTRLLKHSSTLYARAAVAPLDVDDALLSGSSSRTSRPPRPDLGDAETPRKPPARCWRRPRRRRTTARPRPATAAPRPRSATATTTTTRASGRRPASRRSSTTARSADLDAPPPRRAASPVKDKHLCYVCCLARRNAVIMECGHGGLCFECGKSLAQRHPRTCQRPVAVKIFERF
ncbi:hypothetical protein JL720_9344 [Aureococcus anophagefferens]|nr:hypothetical protein JL720_9344 [Aureococcus anophagefferens]